MFADDAWTSPQRTPPLYPDAVTLEPDASPDSVLARVDAGAGCSVKDSFADLDLRPHGFEILFSAEWIVRPAQPTPSDPTDAAGTLRWAPIVDERDLRAWAAAWADDGAPPELFGPSLLRRDEIVMLGGYDADRLVAGALWNRSATVVGLSNVFTTTAAPDEVWTGCLGAGAQRFPDLPIVGYESGDSFDVARRHGFTQLGPLRIWVKES